MTVRKVTVPIERPDLGIISALSEESLGARACRNIPLGAAASLTWVANLAVFTPFSIARPMLVREFVWYNGSVGAANIDCGVYDPLGNRLFSLGSTAQSGTSVPQQSSTLTDVTLAPGDYYLAFSCSGTTNTVGGWAPAAPLAAAFGVGQVALGSVTLTSTATIVPLTNALMPAVAINGYTVAP